MQKLSSSLTLFTAILAMVFMVGSVSADDLGGPISFVASWTLTEPDVNAFSSVDSAAYDANAIIVPDLIQITDFNCNAKFKITATKSSWTLPANYHASDGAKRTDGSDSDLLLMVDNIINGYPSIPQEGLSYLGTYNAYTAITTTVTSDIIGGGAIGVDAHGVDNASCDINAKILMDWATDIVGTYSITVTLSISEVTE